MRRWPLLAFMLLMVLVLAACGGNNEEGTENNGGGEDTSMEEEGNKENSEEKDSQDEGENAETEELTVDLKDVDDNDIGTAKLKQQDNGVLISLDASELPPEEHGFHIHEKGTCETPDFESAGGHFNPTDVSHGTKSEDGPHAGDLPNITVGEDGTVQEEVTAENVTLAKGEDNSLLKEEGTALVIHATADDNKSQPSGDAGERIACGVIEEGLLE